MRTIRIILAVIFLVAISLLFVDFSGYAATHWGFLAKLQFVPALLSANFIIVVTLLLLTLLLGRIYCSVICPMGVLQDCFIRLRTSLLGSKRSRQNRFRYHRALNVLRYGSLAVFATLVIAGLVWGFSAWVAGLIEPYSAFGRIVAPTCTAVGIVTLVVIAALALTRGRLWCNTICPVGTVLGLVSRFSLFKVRINLDKCNSCGLCGRNCKAECIDSKNHTIDHSRCVDCMDCLGKCHQGALTFSLPHKSKATGIRPVAPASQTQTQPKATDAPDASRRKFMATIGLVGGALAVQAATKTTDGGLTPLKNRRTVRTVPVVPPGAKSLKHLTGVCTACQLCIQNCPEGILVPATTLEGFMQPRMDFLKGYCYPECVRCSEVCPTGAIAKIDLPEKSTIKIGTAVVDPDTCIGCGVCQRKCPAGAVTMVKLPGGKRRAAVFANRCIGCGSCEYHCPVGSTDVFDTDSPAIHVEGIEVHRRI